MYMYIYLKHEFDKGMRELNKYKYKTFFSYIYIYIYITGYVCVDVDKTLAYSGIPED